ncbi:MAG: hypothetical protein ACYCXP_10545 [Leptospirillum sp.]
MPHVLMCDQQFNDEAAPASFLLPSAPIFDFSEDILPDRLGYLIRQILVVQPTAYSPFADNYNLIAYSCPWLPPNPAMIATLHRVHQARIPAMIASPFTV